MPPGLTAAIVAAIVVMGAYHLVRHLVRHRRRDSPRGLVDSDATFDPLETAEIDARLHAIASDHASEQSRRMATLVQHLVDRGVPARAVEVVPGLSEARIRFADGTTVLATGRRPGDLGVLAGVIRECSATPARCTTDAAGTMLTFGWLGATRRLSVRIVGIDQPT